MRRAAYILIFLELIQERNGDMFLGLWDTFIHTLLGIPNIALPIKVRLIDFIVICLLLVARGRPGAQKMRAKPMDKAMFASLATIVVTEIWGIVINGGNFKVTFVQLRPFIIMQVTAFFLIAVLRTPRDFHGLGKVILAAAFWRALMCLWFYLFVARQMDPIPPYMTTHFDSVTFVVGILILCSYALEFRTGKAILAAFLGSAVLLVAIQLNNRRLAFISLFAGLAVLYALFPSNRAKRTLNRYIVPTVGLYLAIGLGTGATKGPFKPLAAISTSGGAAAAQDSSARARDMENMGVILLLTKSPLLSTGWGHEYTPVTRAYTVEEGFAETWSIPHNNMLMIVCFNGMLGFMGIWIIFPVCVFFNARAYRAASAPIERVAAATSIAALVVYWNQVFGDMGFINYDNIPIVASAIAVCSRLSVYTGGWPEKGKSMSAAPAQRGPAKVTAAQPGAPA